MKITEHLKIKNISLIISVVLLFVLTFNIGSLYQLNKTKKDFLSIRQIRAKNTDYPLVNRLIGTEIPSADHLGFYTDIKDDLKNTIRKKEYSSVSNFSLYFRDLNTGLWFGINEDEEYIPASLFKIPIAITYFRKSIDDDNLLNSYLPYTNEEAKEITSIQNLDTTTLTLGQSYTVLNLLSKMLIDSDNGAQRVLANNISQEFLNKLYSIIEVAGPAQDRYYISPKEYAFFLRMLYNGSYLGLDKSEQLLEILSKTAFNLGIKKGIPDDIPVIHKFGSVNFTNNKTGEKTTGVHDCGIIYYPEKPYVLCIMTKGGDQKTEIKEIEEVSDKLFDYINKN